MKKQNKTDSIFNVAFLQSGRDYIINDWVKVKHPTMQDIYSLGNGVDCENIYWEYVSLLLCDPYDNMVLLDDLCGDYEEATSFDVFIIKWKLIHIGILTDEYDNQKSSEKLSGKIKSALSFFLGEHEFEIVQMPQSEQHCIVDVNTKNSNGFYDYYISPDMFNLIGEFLFAINKMDKSDRINPANDGVKRILINNMREEREYRAKNKDKDKNDDYLGIAVNAICCGGSGVNYQTVLNYTIYQVLSSYKISIKKNHIDHVMNGVYFGTVDMDKINKSDLNWIE